MPESVRALRSKRIEFRFDFGMARQCRKHGIPWRIPSEFLRLGVLPLRLTRVAEGQPWAREFARRVMLRNFRLDQEMHCAEEE
jgi:hypothetical protein